MSVKKAVGAAAALGRRIDTRKVAEAVGTIASIGERSRNPHIAAVSRAVGLGARLLATAGPAQAAASTTEQPGGRHGS